MGGATLLLTLLVIGGVDLAVGQNCADPGQVANAQRTVSTGTTATFVCNAGFSIGGIASQQTIFCRNGVWDPLPSCTGAGASGCGDPPTIPNGQQPVFSSTSVGSTAVYQCVAGSTMSGSPSVVCQTGGQWSLRPTCTPSTGGGGGGTGTGCGTPPLVANAGRTVFSTAIGGSARYACQTGFTLQGSATIFCQNTGQWTAVPTCQQTGGGGGGTAQGCFDPGQVANANRELRSTAVGGTVVYTCQSGFTGGGTITCQSNGQWTTRPTCTQSTGGGGAQGCFDPGQVPNADRRVVSTLVGGTVVYTCRSGFTGGGTITCQSNGQWTTRPTCTLGTGGGGTGADCGVPSTVANAGRGTLTSTRAGATVTYTCNAGFTLTGSATRTCQANGQWTAAPTCTGGNIRCPDPGFIPNAYRAAYSTNTVGSTVRYVCYPRFTMSGTTNGVRTCEGSGQWSNPVPACVSSGCSDPAIVPNAQRQTTSTSNNVGAVVTYTCNNGFMLQGTTTTIRCQDNGRWTPYPVCVPQVPTSCGDPGTVTNAARQSLTSTNIAGTAIFQCNPGFSVNGVSNIVRLECLSTGQWTPSPTPSCTQGTTTGCGNPPSVTNGMRTFTSTSPGATATYTCNTGFMLVGSSIALCQSNRQWTTVPTCSSTPTRNCGTAPAIPNAQLISTVGGIATYRCNTGFMTLIGNQPSQNGFRVCQTNGQWSTAPVCSQSTSAMCGDPGPIPNAQRVTSQTSFPVGGIATYTCNAGFQTTIAGQPSSVGLRTCMAGGVWSAAPVCSGCGAPPTVAQSTQSVTTTGSVRSVTYTCNAQYSLQGAATLRCQNGQWTPQQPMCVLSGCGTPPTVANAAAPTVQSMNFGGTASYTCNTGFTLQGTDPITCQTSGQWSAGPTCVQQAAGQCQSPETIQNGRRTVVGTTATYACNPGYTLVGNAQRTCVNTQWTPAAPSCTLSGCGTPPTVQNASPSPANPQTSFGSSVTFTCNTGFTARGTTTVICLNSGQWTAAPTCVRDCAARPTVAQATFVEQTNAVPRTVTYTCNAGFTLQGTATITCQDNGQWTAPPTCVVGGCGNPPSVTNAQAPTVATTNVGGQATYTCNSGFTLAGSPTVSCLANGRWTTPPTCNPTVCPAAPQVANAITTGGTSRIVGATVTYICATGFTLQGNPTITCQTNGQWSTGPSCLRQVECPTAPTVANSRRIPSNPAQTIGTQVTYTCNTGFMIQGSATIQCQSNRQWSTAPTCVSVTQTACTSLPTVANAMSPAVVTLNPLSLRFTCNSGFTLNGQATVTCTNGQWSAAPTCTQPTAPTGCTTLPTVANAPTPTIIGANPVQLRFTCNAGFTLNGQATVTCVNNQWTASPTCTPTTG